MKRFLGLGLVCAWLLGCGGTTTPGDGGGTNMDGGTNPLVDSGPPPPPRRDGAVYRDGCVPQIEICGDRMDQDCDGRETPCGDNDMDNIDACRPGQAPPECDCDDMDPTVRPAFGALPGAPELCDFLDNDCDGRIDEAAACCQGAGQPCAGMGTRGDLCGTDGQCHCTTNAGMAVCPEGRTCCAGGCVDVQNDLNNCGFCQTVCTREADTCSAGNCVCGTTGSSCDNNCTCTAGACGEPCM